MEPTSYPTNHEIERAAAIIRSGGLVAFPTETVYGLGANALDREAVDRIYAAKGRPSTSPLIVHVSSIAMARSLVIEWPENAQLLAEKFWPGPLTLVLPKTQMIPDNVTAGLPSVGLRVPAHEVAIRLIDLAGVPIAAPSANRFTHLSPTEADHVREGLGDRVDAILDAGPTQVGIESTVVSLVDGRTRLLRPGMISAHQIEAIAGFVLLPESEESGPHLSPGLHAKHYSPKTRLLMRCDLPEGRIAYLWRRQSQDATVSIRMPDDPIAYAHDLYSVLHRLDHEKLDAIVIEPVPETEEWRGIRDRLLRALS